MISISSTWGRAAARSWLPESMASRHHRQGFSSEALVLISCSLNVIMVMITQMTPGLWGDPWFTHPHTAAAQAPSLCRHRVPESRLAWASPGGLPPPSLLRGQSEQPNKFQPATKELKGHEREMDIFCCLTLNAVFQSNYLSLLLPLLVHGIEASLNSDSDPWQECGGLGTQWVLPSPHLCKIMCCALSAKKIYNNCPSISDLIPFTLI